MSSKTLYYTYDGKTRAGSYWEFVDKETAKLVFNDGGYYQGTYKFLEGETGMLMTEMYYPQYGLTFDELYSTTAANKKQDDTCIGYVAIVFDNLIEYDASGNVVDDEPANNVLYYGVNYKTDEGILYSVVGGSSAEYYNFIEFEDETL